ncbi:MAG: HIT family protein [Candidatus Nanoarchaeia archaeon]
MNDCVYGNNSALIKPYEHWRLLVDDKQPTLGSALLVVNRNIAKVSDLTKDEAAEYKVIVRDFEEAVRNAFNPDEFYYLLSGNIESHVHWHMVPRYKTDRRFGDRLWNDESYPNLPSLNAEVQDDGILQRISDKLFFGLV